MSAVTIELAQLDALEDILPLVTAYHEFENISNTPEFRRNSVAKLLSQRQLGEIWLIKKNDKLVGYIAICFGYSIEFGGRDAFIDEFYIKPTERGSGTGAETLMQLGALKHADGIVAFHLEVGTENERAKSLYAKLGYSSRDKYHLMSRALSE